MTKKSEARLIRENSRPKEEIDKEYGQTCAKAGDVQYRIKCLEQELNKLNGKLYELNQEFYKLELAEKTATETVVTAVENNVEQSEEAPLGV